MSPWFAEGHTITQLNATPGVHLPRFEQRDDGGADPEGTEDTVGFPARRKVHGVAPETEHQLARSDGAGDDGAGVDADVDLQVGSDGDQIAHGKGKAGDGERMIEPRRGDTTHAHAGGADGLALLEAVARGEGRRSG